MIASLHISNYALISKIDIDFDNGLNIITGETGAGKSIILGALGLIMGGRADLRTLRDPSCKTVVEAIFHIDSSSLLNSYLEENDIDTDPAECILRREITSRGGSRAFINDSPVNLTVLTEAARHLLDIHSQHQNQLLADTAYQLHIIDVLADNRHLLETYHLAYSDYRNALKAYTETRDMLNRNRSEAEFLTYQLEELDALNIKAGEQEQLERDRDVLANMSRIKEHLSGAVDAIDGEVSVVSALHIAADNLQALTEVFGDAAELSDRLTAARLEIDDISQTLQKYDADLNTDPAMLEEVENRLGQIYSLEAKHHVDTDAGLIALRNRLRSQLDTINNGDQTLSDLEDSAKKAKKKAVLIAREISARRIAAAGDFASRLKERCRPLGMENIRCEVAVTQGKLNPQGMDTVDFMFAFNRNQPLMSVGKTASGGEISRVILAIKSIIAECINLPTIIFDEVDTGVSGEIGRRMADLMTDISRTTQVITITHLPQMAARGNRHFKVYKYDEEDTTVTDIKILDTAAREEEIAQMLAGGDSAEDSATALANARSLLKNATKSS